MSACCHGAKYNVIPPNFWGQLGIGCGRLKEMLRTGRCYPGVGVVIKSVYACELCAGRPV